ncbi:hypothetical protein K431DRAFT_234376 [Polychaeton citri CBS 116435]|uniref:Zn(2)-C6 fungal-type domain-containing protein n=1 Tax=Polychaeton citri CBS 116435 TaxID=1314669 RepID=A0A9P4Q007_9PEZI|nr:hypothetical protein K431DRAFT_234376 [Polychaeton citri CBS 116435]
MSSADSSSPPDTRQNPQPRVRRRNRLITSCLECRRRKLKCDKQAPCGNCVRFQRDCLYLASSQDAKSQQKLADLKEKMGMLERSLEKEVASNQKPSSIDEGRAASKPESIKVEADSDDDDVEDEDVLEPTPLTSLDTVYEDNDDDELMDLGVQLGKMRISERIGGWIRPKMVEELNDTLKDVQRGKSRWSTSPQINDHYDLLAAHRQANLLTSPKSYLGPSPDYIAPTSSFYFPGTNVSCSLIDYLPNKTASDRLVTQYWAAVHYLAKVVHRPTFETQYARFWGQIAVGNEPPAAIQAIVFAAMFSASASLTETQASQQFGTTKAALVDALRSGTEMALAKANFLRTTKVDTMQAFVMYIIPLIRAEVSRAHSALMGTAMRLAECMGLHRDPSLYSMKPVETHVRRMIWHQLLFLDMRTAEATGPRPHCRKEDYDTKVPLNIDDRDLLNPNPPTEDHKRWTDMTLMRMRIDCVDMHRQLWFDVQAIDKKKKSLTSVLIKVQKFRAKMEETYKPMMDENVPFQAYAANVLETLLSRCYVQVLHRYLFSTAQKMPDRLRQVVIEAATIQMEKVITNETRPDMSVWSWYRGALHQYHGALLLLVEVYAYPMRKDAKRIWDCLDYVFDIPKQLSPKQKAELVITDLKERMEVYQHMRRLKATTKLEDRVKGVASQGQSLRDLGNPATREGRDEVDGGHAQPGGELNQTEQQASFAAVSPLPPTQFSPPLVYTDSTGGVSRQGSVGGNDTGGPQMMEDIDWAEWDKYFPVETNTGDLDVPDFNFADFTGGYNSSPMAPIDYSSGSSIPSPEELANMNFTPAFVPGIPGTRMFNDLRSN